MNRSRQVAALVVAVVASVMVLTVCIGCSEQPRSDDQDDQTTAAIITGDSLIIEVVGVDSLTVLEVLQSAHKVEFRPSAMGAFVTSIDGIGGSSSHFWVYSVNGEMAEVACDKLISHSGDVIRWHLRRIRD